MAPNSRYTRVSDDEGENIGMISAETSSRSPEWTEKSGKVEKTPWWKYAAGVAVAVALFVPAVSYTSSAMLESRVAKAVEDVLAAQRVEEGLLGATHTTSASSSSETSLKGAEKAVGSDGDGVELLLSNGTTIFAGNPMAGKTFEMHDCGSNADEARAKGCAYDVMMQEWTPPECIDWTLSEKFLKKNNWTWYADSGAERWYNDVEVAKGDHSVVYVEQSYHRVHCIFTWEKLVRAMRTQRPMVEKLLDYDHVMHCWMHTLRTSEEGAEAVRGVVAPTVFTKCASMDVWLANLPHNKFSSIERMLRERAAELDEEDLE